MQIMAICTLLREMQRDDQREYVLLDGHMCSVFFYVRETIREKEMPLRMLRIVSEHFFEKMRLKGAGTL